MGPVAFAAILGGCVGGEKLEADSLGADLRELVVAEMQIVAPLVSAELLEKCKAMLERPSWLGTKYEVVGDFVPNVRSSCVAQGRGAGWFSIQNDRKTVVLVALLKKVTGAGAGARAEVAGCRFDLLNGNVTVGGPAPTLVRAGNSCRHVWVFDRAAGRLQARMQQTTPGEMS